MTKIQWTEQVWNPTTGCDRVSPGCDNCYALTMAKRLKGMGSAKYQRDGDPKTSGPGFGLTTHRDTLATPLTWRKPRKVFVNSMSDLFHDDVPASFIAEVFAVMARTPQHTYQLLTKRHGRMRSLVGSPIAGGQSLIEAAPTEAVAQALYDAVWPLPNLWLGVSAEDQQRAELRIPALLETAAAIRWVSAEPLIGAIDFRNLQARNGALIDSLGGDVKSGDGSVYAGTPSVLDWIVLGGESGAEVRPMEAAWIANALDQAHGQTPMFVKQLGTEWARDWSIGGKSVVALGDPKGGDPQHWPTGLDVRQYPKAVTA